MLTIQNLGDWEKIRGIAYAPYAFASYSYELFHAYLVPVMSRTRDWPTIVLVYFGLINGTEVTLKSGGKERITKSSIRALVMKLKDTSKTSTDFGRRVPKYLSYYNGVDARGRVVVDIGAHRADTAIYFVRHHGAKRVIAFEPVESIYKIAVENVSAARLQKRIRLVNMEVLGAKNAGDKSFSLGLGKNNRTITLKNLIRKYGVRRAVLKIDCEGCEHALLSGLPKNSRDIFGEVVVRYYRGYKNIVKRLEGLGYKIKFISQPKYTFANMFRNFIALGTVLAGKE